jgi:hypothetical protein
MIASRSGGRRRPASYVQKHVQHAFALTGRGMQGATAEHAIVLASLRPHRRLELHRAA